MQYKVLDGLYLGPNKTLHLKTCKPYVNTINNNVHASRIQKINANFILKD